jgi:cobalamin biosynthesis Co2+ chelatase CbiK
MCNGVIWIADELEALDKDRFVLFVGKKTTIEQHNCSYSCAKTFLLCEGFIVVSQLWLAKVNFYLR